jgi:prevent-host-death family protein
MEKIIGVTDLQRNFRAVFDEVANKHMPFVLTRGSRPEAVLIPYADYLRYQQMEESDVLQRVDLLLANMAEKNAGYSSDEVAVDVEVAVREARADFDS